MAELHVAGDMTTAPGSPHPCRRSKYATERVAELPREQYELGKRHGRNRSLPICPWSLPASQWTPQERHAYIVGLRNGHAEASPEPRRR